MGPLLGRYGDVTLPVTVASGTLAMAQGGRLSD